MKDAHKTSFPRAILAATIFLFVLALIPLGWVFFAFNAKYRTCVNLPNGLDLGFEAVFDLRRPYFKPIVVPKYSDGTPLIRDETWAIFVSETTVYGLTMRPNPEDDDRYAWRDDTKLVWRSAQPEAYNTLIAEAGNTNWDIEIGNVGPGWLLNELIRSGRFPARHCATALLTW